jgi:hypothetical protein
MILAVMASLTICIQRSVASIHIDWDPGTLQLIQRGGGYPRMTRIKSGLLCCFEWRGGCWVRRSLDEGKTWQNPVRVVGYEFGYAANPEMLALRDGGVMLFYNGRPRDGAHPFTIGMAISRDQGESWTADAKPIYSAGNVANAGCYEPAAIQLPSGEVDLFFANEFPYKNGEQEISLMRSSDGGKTWSAARTVSFRRHGRDGMPVPIVLRNEDGMLLAIEDNGLTPDHQLKPVIIKSPQATSWTGPVAAGDSPRRWGAVDQPWTQGTYAGAPYLRQLFTGETILSCQSDQTRGRPRPHPCMVVYVGDRNARHFADPTEPFPLDDDARGMWNSLFVKNRSTITAISVTTINGIAGVWAIDGTVNRN